MVIQNGELKEAITRRLILRSIPEMVIWQPEPEIYIFISGTTTVRIEIPTANFGLAITESSKKVCPGNCNNNH